MPWPGCRRSPASGRRATSGAGSSESDGDDRTAVTHYHDWADVTDPALLDRIREVTPDEMRATIENLAEALA